MITFHQGPQLELLCGLICQLLKIIVYWVILLCKKIEKKCLVFKRKRVKPKQSYNTLNEDLASGKIYMPLTQYCADQSCCLRLENFQPVLHS